MRTHALALCATLCAPPALAGTPITLYNLPGGGDGVLPVAGLVNVNHVLYGTTVYGGTYGRGTVFSILPSGHEKIIHSFAGTADGAFPAASLLLVNGLLYGTTQQGGAGENGTVFAINPATGTETTLYAFNAGAGLFANRLIHVGAALYGTASSGGANNYGTVFRVNLKSGQETTLYSFTDGADGANPFGGLINVGGVLYGTTGNGTINTGTIFSLTLATGTLVTLHQFANYQTEGGYPQGTLLSVNGLLYGTTSGGGAHDSGTVFAFNPQTSSVSTLYTFTGNSDGCYPWAGVIHYGTTLYGTTFGCGGNNGDGTVFSLDTVTGAETTLYSFTGGADGARPQSPVIGVGTTLFGTSADVQYDEATSENGAVFAINLKTGAESNLHDFIGSFPYTPSTSALLNVANTLFGTTAEGGTYYYGSVFKLDPNTGAGTTLYSFTGAADGGIPSSALVAVGDLLYGVTLQGGPGHCGTIFTFNPTTNAQSVVHAFACDYDGGYPNGTLLNVSGTLYGTTESAGFSGSGTIFKFDPATGTLTQLYFFTGSPDAGGPLGGLIDVGGTLYGVSYGGGPFGLGTVFAFDLNTGQETLVYEFGGGSYGESPVAAPHYLGANLYVTTQGGGKSTLACPGGCGMVWRINPTTQNGTVLHQFHGATDGAFPSAALINIGATLYGSTEAGGPDNAGTMFTFDTANGTFATTYTFTNGPDGGAPKSPLIDTGSTLYGTTSTGGAANAGTVFSITP